MYADKSPDLRRISDALSDPERIPSIQGDFAVIDDKSVEHVKVSPTYYLGSLPTLSKLRWFFTDQPMLLALLALSVCVAVAAALYRPLRHMAKRRLQKQA
jgi:cellulose synthase (UDP-forming)